MIFKRKIYDELLRWKRTDNGKTAVLIQGARRVGKSTVAEEFAANEYDSHILVDFAACSNEIRDLFNDLSDMNCIITLSRRKAESTTTKWISSSPTPTRFALSK